MSKEFDPAFDNGCHNCFHRCGTQCTFGYEVVELQDLSVGNGEDCDEWAENEV